MPFFALNIRSLFLFVVKLKFFSVISVITSQFSSNVAKFLLSSMSRSRVNAPVLMKSYVTATIFYIFFAYVRLLFCTRKYIPIHIWELRFIQILNQEISSIWFEKAWEIETVIYSMVISWSNERFTESLGNTICNCCLSFVNQILQKELILYYHNPWQACSFRQAHSFKYVTLNWAVWWETEKWSHRLLRIV